MNGAPLVVGIRAGRGGFFMEKQIPFGDDRQKGNSKDKKQLRQQILRCAQDDNFLQGENSIYEITLHRVTNLF